MSDFKLVSILNTQPIYNNVSGILAASLSGNTDGVLADISTGTFYLIGGNNITLSQDSNSVSIIGGAGGGGGGGVAIAAGTQTATTNTIVFSNSNNVTFGMSGSTRVTASASFPAQTNQTVGLYASSNTYLTSSGTVDARSLSFRGDKSITVGISAGEVVFSVGAYLTTAMASNRGSDFVAATAAFNGTNASGTIASDNISVSVAAQSAQSAIKAFGATNTGNTSGNTGVSTGIDWVLAGTNNITISESTAVGGPNTLWVSGAAAGGAQTAISGIIVSDATYTSGTVSFSNAGNITISSSVNGVTQYIRLSVAAQTNQTVGLYASSNTYLTSSGTVDARSLSFRGDKSITVGISAGEVVFSVGAYLTTAMASNRGTDFVAATAGFNGTNASGTIASNSISVSVAAPIPIGTNVKAVASIGSTGTITRYAPEDHQHRGVAAFAVTNTGNTLGDTRSQVGTFFIAASGGITASQSTAAAGNDTVWLSVAAPIAQTNQTLGLYAVSNTEGASSSSTFDARTVSFQGKGAVSVGFSNGSVVIDAPSAAAGNVTFSAGANSSGLASVIFSNSNGVSFGLGAGSVITASAAGGGGIGGGVSTGGNTAGSTGTVTTGNIIFVGSNAISLSQSTGAAGSAATITIDSPATSSLVGSNGVSLSVNGSTITISGWTLPHFEPFPMLLSGSTTYAPAIGSIMLQPFVIPALISGGRINRMTAFGSTASILRDSSANFASNTTGSRAMRFQYSNVIGLYSLGAGANSTRLESAWSSMHSLELSHTVSVATGGATTVSASVRGTITYIASINSAGAVTTSSYSNSGSSSSASSAMNTSVLTSVLSSIRNMLSSQILLPVPFNTTITPGMYWLAEFWTTASSTTGTSGDALSVVNRVGLAGFTSGTAYRNFAATVASSGSNIFPGEGGVFSGTSAALPATIAFSDIRTQALMPIQYFNYINSTI